MRPYYRNIKPFDAADKIDIESLNTFLGDGWGINSRNKSGGTIAFDAAWNYSDGGKKILNWFLRHGGDINLTDEYSENIGFIFAGCNNLSGLKWFKSKGGNCTQVNTIRMTIYQTAEHIDASDRLLYWLKNITTN